MMARELERISALATISVNVDNLDCFHEKHGIAAPADPLAIYTVALPRVLALLESVHARATFFVSGKDLEHAHAAAMLRDVAARGHEIATRGYQHAPNLREWSKLSVAEEIEKGSAAIVRVIGRRPMGFRAPGYNADTRVLQLLAERGFKYDSSVFPSLPYYAAQGALRMIGRLRGQGAGAGLTPHNLRAPTQPYRPSRWAFWEAGSRKHSLPIWEIPVGLVRGLGLPLTGGVVRATHDSMQASLYRSYRLGQPTLHLEFEAIDLMDASDAAIRPELAKKRPALGLASERSSARLASFIQRMQQDYRVVTMDELSDALERRAGPTVVS